MRSAFLLVTVLVALMAPFVAAMHATPSDNMELRRVVFAHRHGARTPVKNLNGSCDQLGCGALLPEGQGMLESLGKHFAQAYGYKLFGNNTATGRPKYDYNTMRIQSDESERVIQSAGAFWNGLWGANDGLTAKGAPHIPVIKTDATNLIDPWSVPTFHLHSIPMDVAVLLNLTKYAEKHVISAVDVVEIGKEMGLKGLECDVVPAACIGLEIDFLQSMNAQGKLADYPLGAKFYSKLSEVETMYMHYVNGQWDESVKKTNFYDEAGWPGATLAKSMISDMLDGGISFSEYSGHDTTLMPLYAALGNQTWAYPQFATALVFEVYQNTSSSSTDLFVKATVGAPEQTPGSGWPYTFTPYALKCKDAHGNIYTTTAGCPVQDLWNFVAPRAPRSTCYGWPGDLKDNLCEPADNSGLSTGSTPCGRYRSACPFEACGAGRYMASNLTCISL